MKRLLMATACLLGMAFVTAANADDFTLSDFAGNGNFGTFTVLDLGAQPGSTDTVQIVVDMNPNILLDTGSHYVLTLSLLGTGRIDAASFNLVGGVDVFDAAEHTVPATYQNSPFGLFTDAVIGACGNGSSTGDCGSLLTFNVTNYQGLGFATNTFDGHNITAAADIFLSGCVGELCTGAVGANSVAVPGPIVGAGLPGLVMACTGLIGLARRRRNKAAAAA